MLQELYGGRRALRTYLLTGRFVDIRLPPLGRNPEGVRLPMPRPRARPKGAERRAKYFSNLAADLDDYAQTGARNPHRTTMLWEEFSPQAGQEEYRSRRHAREADRLNHARGGALPRSPRGLLELGPAFPCPRPRLRCHRVVQSVSARTTESASREEFQDKRHRRC